MNNALVIIPTYNEKDNIALILEAVFALSEPFHVLVVDDGSPDGTAEMVKDLQQTYNTPATKLHLLQREGKLGLGTAYITGFKFALEKGYEFVLEMDADFSHDPKDLAHLLTTCKAPGCDLSIGSRYATGVNVVNWPIGRVLLSYFASSYVRLITGMPIMDTTAGFVCYRKKVLETIPLDEIKFVGFDLMENGEYLDTLNTKLVIRDILELPHVKELYIGKWSQEIQDEFVFNNFIDGTKVPHEGIVVKHTSGERNKIAKVINPDYLIYGEKHDIGDSH